MSGERTTTGGSALRRGTTEAITGAAIAELAERGYGATSMESVARRAGVGKAALYRRWSSKQEMLGELIAAVVERSLPPTPDTGALRSDLRVLLGALRDQLAHPLVGSIAPGLLGEARHSEALAGMLQGAVAAPRRAAAQAVLQAAVDRGELPAGLDRELAVDLLIAPLAFRVVVLEGEVDDAGLETLVQAVEAALRVAVRM